MLRLPVDDAVSMGLSVILGFPFIVTLFLLRPLLSALGLWEVARTDKALRDETGALFLTSTDLSGKVCVVTGANCGIGLHTAAQAASGQIPTARRACGLLAWGSLAVQRVQGVNHP